MSDLGVKIPFAIRQSDGKIVSVDKVERGLACDCQCPACHAALAAVKGNLNVHHFRHHKRSDDLCEFAAETSVRLMLLDMLTAENYPEPLLFHAPDLTVELSKSCGDIRESGKQQRKSHEVPVYVHQLDGHPQILLSLRPTETPATEETCIGLYLPAANQRLLLEPDIGFAQYIERWPRRGLLGVNYGALVTAIWLAREDGDETPITEILVNSLLRDGRSLTWIYHPSRRDIESRLTQELEVKLQRRVVEAQRQVQLEQERARLAQEQAERDRLNRERAIQARGAQIERYRLMEVERAKRYREVQAENLAEAERRSKMGLDQVKAKQHEQLQQRKQEEAAARQARMNQIRFGNCHVCGVVLEQASAANLCDAPECIAQWERGVDDRESKGKLPDHGWLMAKIRRLILDNSDQIDGVAGLYWAPVVRGLDCWVVQTDRYIYLISEAPIAGACTAPNLVYSGAQRYALRTARTPELDQTFQLLSIT